MVNVSGKPKKYILKLDNFILKNSLLYKSKLVDLLKIFHPFDIK